MVVVKPGMIYDDIDAATKAYNSIRQHVNFVSNTSKKFISWPYGELRGGSNALLMKDRYIALSKKTVLPGSPMIVVST